LRLGHGKRIAVIALVDLGDHLAGGDVLVVGDRGRREVFELVDSACPNGTSM
jgi:hypothetical protein